MKSRKLGFAVFSLGLMVALSGALPTGATAGSGRHTIAWREGGLRSALAQARRQNTLVLVDVYADWCGWCGEMDRRTYADRQVVQAMRGFVTVRIDADSAEGQAFSERYGVEGLPTLVVLDADGSVVSTIEGFVEPRELLRQLARLS